MGIINTKCIHEVKMPDKRRELKFKAQIGSSDGIFQALDTYLTSPQVTLSLDLIKCKGPFQNREKNNIRHPRSVIAK